MGWQSFQTLAQGVYGGGMAWDTVPEPIIECIEPDFWAKNGILSKQRNYRQDIHFFLPPCLRVLRLITSEKIFKTINLNVGDYTL